MGSTPRRRGIRTCQPLRICRLWRCLTYLARGPKNNLIARTRIIHHLLLSDDLQRLLIPLRSRVMKGHRKYMGGQALRHNPSSSSQAQLHHHQPNLSRSNNSIPYRSLFPVFNKGFNNNLSSCTVSMCKRCKKSIRDGDRAVEALGGKWR